MAWAWRLQVFDHAGAAKPTIELDDAVASLESFSSDPMWSSGEATFTALPGSIDVEVRDIVRLIGSDDDFATLGMPLYQGVIVSAGNARASRLQRFRAIGMKQRAYEVTLFDRVIPGGDVAVMGTTILTAAAARINGAALPFGGFPNLGFQLGDRYPRLETAGDAMDAIVATVGSFVVPSGETYTYDGVTWTAGQTVPETRWGANTTGQFILARPRGPTLAFNESDPLVRVDWRPNDAEEVVDRVTLVYASQYNGDPRVVNAGFAQPEIPTPTPLSATASKAGSTLAADRVVNLDAPLDFMQDGITSTSSSGAIVNPANAYDGNPATYAQFPADGPGTPAGTMTAIASPAEGAIVLLDIMLTTASFYDSLGFEGNNANITVSVQTSAGATVTNLYYNFAPALNERRTFALPITAEASATGTPGRVSVVVAAAEGFRLYNLEILTIDADAATRLAEAFYREAIEGVAAIDYQGILDTGLASRAEHVQVTTIDAATVTSRVERFEVSFTVDEGVRTTIYAGQGYDAEQEAQRVILERLARRAVAAGGAKR